jgi:hypothetical protein
MEDSAICVWELDCPVVLGLPTPDRWTLPFWKERAKHWWRGVLDIKREAKRPGGAQQKEALTGYFDIGYNIKFSFARDQLDGVNTKRGFFEAYDGEKKVWSYSGGVGKGQRRGSGTITFSLP